MSGAFFKQINALERNREILATHRVVFKEDLLSSEIVYYLVLQGFPTTITLTLRDATALRAFPCNDYMKSLIQ